MSNSGPAHCRPAISSPLDLTGLAAHREARRAGDLGASGMIGAILTRDAEIKEAANRGGRFAQWVQSNSQWQLPLESQMQRAFSDLQPNGGSGGSPHRID